MPQKKHTKMHTNQLVDENRYILFALRAEQIKDYKSATILFEKLFDTTKNREYLYRSLKNRVALHDYHGIVQEVNSVDKRNKDENLLRFKVIALLFLKKYEQAHKLATELVKISATTQNHLLMSDVFLQEAQYDKALSYLEKIYKQKYNEIILDKICIVLYVNKLKKEQAIEKIENHLKAHGPSKLLLRRLIWIYAKENNLDGLVTSYEKLYSIDKNNEVSKKIIQIYSYTKEYIKLMNFLENFHSNDRVLLQLYVNLQDYKKAYLLAKKLYLESGEVNYLGQSAIYEYESSQDKKDKKMLQRVIKKLEDVISLSATPLYLNYLGYVLIDHDIDVKRGIAYVKDALKSDPDSIYYLDSLAWGYYKLGNCREAKAVVKKFDGFKNSKNEEVIFHLNAINRCLKN